MQLSQSFFCFRVLRVESAPVSISVDEDVAGHDRPGIHTLVQCECQNRHIAIHLDRGTEWMSGPPLLGLSCALPTVPVFGSVGKDSGLAVCASIGTDRAIFRKEQSIDILGVASFFSLRPAFVVGNNRGCSVRLSYPLCSSTCGESRSHSGGQNQDIERNGEVANVEDSVAHGIELNLFLSSAIGESPIGCHNPRFSIRSARSTRRLEKPHSLSYHARILTSLPPITKVESPSIMDERGSPR